VLEDVVDNFDGHSVPRALVFREMDLAESSFTYESFKFKLSKCLISSGVDFGHQVAVLPAPRQALQ